MCLYSPAACEFIVVGKCCFFIPGSLLPLGKCLSIIPRDWHSGGTVNVSTLPAVSHSAESRSQAWPTRVLQPFVQRDWSKVRRGMQPNQSQPESFHIIWPMNAGKDKFLSFELWVLGILTWHYSLFTQQVFITGLSTSRGWKDPVMRTYTSLDIFDRGNLIQESGSTAWKSWESKKGALG